MEHRKINGIGDLRSEIIRLKAEVDMREVIIEEQFNTITEQIKAPFQFVKRIGDWFGGSEKDQASSDWMTSILQLGLPYLMSKTFFRHSGLITKAVVTLISQKAVTGINFNTLTSWIKQLSQWLRKQKEEKSSEDFGIPPDSEAS